MKKRIFTLLLTCCMTASLLSFPAQAASSGNFSDVTDQTTATAIEVLRLMGVLDGYADGTFRPGASLTRAQFCKMAVYALDASGEVGRYSTVTVFPDVKPSHWASSYINLAAKGKNVIGGFADGRFRPDQVVTTGQAVTILLRVLGYKDENIGGVWPDSYLALGETNGLLDGTGITSGAAALTRGQAARLFLNLLRVNGAAGTTLYTLSAETTLSSVDLASGTMKTAASSYTMARPVASTTLRGSKGRVVQNTAGKALTFLPVTSSGGISNAAVVLYEDRSTNGLNTLAGTSSYTIYKNGLAATAGDLRKYDVATYSAGNNAVLVCDTRVTVYYESCEPNANAPTTITALGGTIFPVLPTAMDSLAKFKPGQQITLLLTADGQVASAVEASGTSARGNAVATVNASGAVQFLCGSTWISVKGAADASHYGQVVRLSGSKSGLSLSTLSGGASGDWDVVKGTLGSRKLTNNALVFDGGTEISPSQLTNGIIKSGQITYVRTNWNDQVDLIILNGSVTNERYGRVNRYSEQTMVDNGSGVMVPVTVQKIAISCGNGTSDQLGPFEVTYDVSSGDYAAVVLNSSNTGFTNLTKLSKLRAVSKSAWVGKSAVTYGGVTYSVPSNVQCYNVDNNTWISLDAALDYASEANLYAKDGVVRIVEVKS